MTGQRPFFYGWVMVVVGFLCYGLGLAPAYYSWGYYGPELIDELGLSRTEIGLAFGLFGLTYSLAAPLSAVSISFLGLRQTMTLGPLMAALGFFLLSRANSAWDCYLSFSFIAGLGIGLGNQLPCQTIASFWFKKYRARALAAIISGGGIVGVGVPYANQLTLELASWRTGWEIIALVSLGVAMTAALLVRNKPEDLGQYVDGLGPGEEQEYRRLTAAAMKGQVWTARQAIRTRQFVLITIAAMACSAPWGAFTAHGRIHLEALGFALVVITFIWSLRSFVSIFGRVGSAIADFVSPRTVLALALLMEGLGIGGLTFANSTALAYVFVSMFALGFGVALLAVPLVFAYFFGANAFSGAQGSSRFTVGLVRFGAPTLTGMLADSSGSYTQPFLCLVALCAVGSLCAFFCPRPGPPPAMKIPVNSRID